MSEKTYGGYKWFEQLGQDRSEWGAGYHMSEIFSLLPDFCDLNVYFFRNLRKENA